MTEPRVALLFEVRDEGNGSSVARIEMIDDASEYHGASWPRERLSDNPARASIEAGKGVGVEQLEASVAMVLIRCKPSLKGVL